MPNRFDDEPSNLEESAPSSDEHKKTVGWMVCLCCCFVLIALFTILMVYLLESGIPPAPVFSQDVSYRHLLYAYAAYHLPAVGEWNCPYCIDETSGFHVTRNCIGTGNDSFAYVGYHIKHTEVVISFRGAADPSLWILQVLNVIKVPPYYPFPGVENAFVASDFFLIYQDMRACLVDALNELQQLRYPLVIVGHGLGGAVAGIAALELKMSVLPTGEIDVYTYGQPRVGNKAYRDAILAKFGVKYQRMVNYDDCVPKLPKHEIGYVHNPFEIFEYMGGENKYKVCDNSGEDETCSLSVDFDCIQHFNYMGIQCCGRP